MKQTKKKPELLDMAAMKEILTAQRDNSTGQFFLNNEKGILHGNPQVFRIVVQEKAPFIINDHRMGLITRGEAKTTLNLVERHLKAGSMVYLAPGSIINPVSFSDDFKISGIALFSDFTMPFASDKMPSAFNGQMCDMVLPTADEDIIIVKHIMDALWHLVHQDNYPRPVASSLVAALMNLYNDIYKRSTEHHAKAITREQTIFDRFIQLVNQHCKEQHQLAYYASRICLTERYLGTVIRQTSGVTAKEWIDRALITLIKIELIHTDKAVASISDELHFPNPSFFCKYFRRITGVTPGEYRSGRQKTS